MSLEWLNTFFLGATFVVIAATAVAALVQLRHIRDGNQITTLLNLFERRSGAEFRAVNNYVFFGELDRKLQDPEYRKQLARTPVDLNAHPEMQLLFSWEQLGAMMKLGWFSETAFMETAGAQAIVAWKKLNPVVAITRRERGPQIFDNFEYLASRAMLWEATHTRGTFPKETPHLAAIDPFPEDTAPHVS